MQWKQAVSAAVVLGAVVFGSPAVAQTSVSQAVMTIELGQADDQSWLDSPVWNAERDRMIQAVLGDLKKFKFDAPARRRVASLQIAALIEALPMLEIVQITEQDLELLKSLILLRSS